MVLVEKMSLENKTIDETINFLLEKNLHELLQEAFAYEKKLVGEFDEIRRF